MPKTYVQIHQEIEALQKQAASLRRKGQSTLVKIKAAIAQYGFTAEELGLGSPVKVSKVSAKKPARHAGAKKAPRKTHAKGPAYQDGAGNTWEGRGRRPQWLRDALAAGQSIEDFRV